MSTALKIMLALAFVAVLALPFVLKPAERKTGGDSLPLNLPVRKLVIISPHWDGIRTEFGRAFAEWAARNLQVAAKIEWLDVGGSSDAIRYVKSEYERSPGGINIDLFFGGGVDPFIQLADAGRLEPCNIPPEILSVIPPQLNGVEVYDPQGRWFGACLSGFGILYNKKVCDTLKLAYPLTWEDLAKPEYFTWIASGDPRSSGSIHMVYEIILQAYGWEKGWSVIARMCGNTRNFSRAAAEVPKDTAVGEVACGTCIDSYGWRQVMEVGPDRMGFALPDGVTVINPDSVAILKGAPNRDLAEQFIRFVLSEEGQKLWMLKVGTQGGPVEFELDRMPVIPGLARKLGDLSAVTCDAFDWKSGFTYSPATGSARWTALNDLLGAMLIDTHGELAAAWKTVKDLPADDPRVRNITTPPMTEQELMSLAKGKWKDAEFRAKTCAQWANEAKDRYRRIARDKAGN